MSKKRVPPPRPPRRVPGVPPEVAALLLKVHGELQRLLASGFLADVKELRALYDDFGDEFGVAIPTLKHRLG